MVRGDSAKWLLINAERSSHICQSAGMLGSFVGSEYLEKSSKKGRVRTLRDTGFLGHRCSEFQRCIIDLLVCKNPSVSCPLESMNEIKSNNSSIEFRDVINLLIWCPPGMGCCIATNLQCVRLSKLLRDDVLGLAGMSCTQRSQKMSDVR